MLNVGKPVAGDCTHWKHLSLQERKVSTMYATLQTSKSVYSDPARFIRPIRIIKLIVFKCIKLMNNMRKLVKRVNTWQSKYTVQEDTCQPRSRLAMPSQVRVTRLGIRFAVISDKFHVWNVVIGIGTRILISSLVYFAVKNIYAW